jgi:5-formyltetrahydrofolate cyclo-ligase
MPEFERKRMGTRIAERFFELPEVQEASVVMGFWSFGSEVPTAPILERLARDGAVVALPRIVEGELVSLRWRVGDRMSPTSFGAQEPDPEAEPVNPRTIDVVMTPAAALDRFGNRIGYGGGFYDRFLTRLGSEAIRVAIVFGVQIVEELPAGGSDVGVDVAVTESETIRFRSDT